MNLRTALRASSSGNRGSSVDGTATRPPLNLRVFELCMAGSTPPTSGMCGLHAESFELKDSCPHLSQVQPWLPDPGCPAEASVAAPSDVFTEEGSSDRRWLSITATLSLSLRRNRRLFSSTIGLSGLEVPPATRLAASDPPDVPSKVGSAHISELSAGLRVFRSSAPRSAGPAASSRKCHSTA